MPTGRCCRWVHSAFGFTARTLPVNADLQDGMLATFLGN